MKISFEKIRKLLWANVGYNVGSQMYSQVDVRVGAQVESQLVSQVESRRRVQVLNKINQSIKSHNENII